jgi:hypothetical protein
MQRQKRRKETAVDKVEGGTVVREGVLRHEGVCVSGGVAPCVINFAAE